MSNERFEPVIIGFTCNWCSYRGRIWLAQLA